MSQHVLIMGASKIICREMHPEEFKFKRQLTQVDLFVLSSCSWGNQLAWFFQRQHVALNIHLVHYGASRLRIGLHHDEEAKWTMYAQRS